MEPTEVLRKALQAVGEAEVPDDLRELAFAKAVDLYSRPDQPQPPVDEGGAERVGQISPGVQSEFPASDGLANVASALGIDPNYVEEFFAETEEEELMFTHDPDPLGTNNADRARAVSLLLACARQYGGYDSTSTSYATLKEECERLHIYDSKHFSTQVSGMTKFFVVSGSGQSRTFKAKPSAKVEAKRHIETLMAG